MIAAIGSLKEGQGKTWLVTAVVAAVALAIAVGGALAVGSGGGIDPINLFVEGKLSGNSQEFLGGLIGGTALFAFAAGMASAVNPCGFAMLPAYLGLYLGSNLAEEERPGPVAALLRGVRTAGTAGRRVAGEKQRTRPPARPHPAGRLGAVPVPGQRGTA